MSSSQTGNQHQNGSDFQPYIGLRPFTEQEQDRFFGRSEEISILLDKIQANRLTLLLAASGVGKSSLLQAGIMPELRKDNNVELIYYNEWSNSLKAFKQAVNEHYAEPYKDVSLKSILRSCTLFSSNQLVFFLDQFEEFFNYHRFKTDFHSFIEELSAAVLDRSLPVSFVFSMREDFALELNSFKKTLPGIFDNYFRLEKLTEEQAREAIQEPLHYLNKKQKTDYCFAPSQGSRKALLEQILDDLGKREQERQFGVEETFPLKKLSLLVEPPHLQIVCQELWKQFRDNEVNQITHEAYEKAGKTAGILNSYFLGKIELFSKKEQVLASAAFDHLVGTRAVKIAHPLGRLAELARADAEGLQAVLDRLQDYAILRRQKRGEEFWYELYHDIFSESIDHWNKKFKVRQRVKGFAYGAIVGLIAGGVLFAANNWRVNHYGRYLQLSSKKGVVDRIEMYQGGLNGLDLFQRRKFLYESPFQRQELEADRLFHRVTIGDRGIIRQEVITRLPISDRFSRYIQDGLYSRGRNLAKDILDTQDSGRIKEQVRQVSRIRSKRVLGELNEVLNGKDQGGRSAAIEALGYLGFDSFIPQFILLLKDNESTVRVSAVRSLGQLGAVSAVPQIIPLLKDNKNDVRSAAFRTLDQLGANSAFSQIITPLMIQLLSDNRSEVRSEAIQALGRLNAVSASPQIMSLLKDNDQYVRYEAIKTLAQLGVASSAPQIISFLKNDNEFVRSAAVDALRRLDYDLLISQIMPYLKDDNWKVRFSVVQALGQLGEASVAFQVIPFLKDNNWEVRFAAIQALGQLGEASVALQIIPFLKDNNWEVRFAAIQALGQLGETSTVPQIIPLLKDNNGEIRFAAIEALGQLGETSTVLQVIPFLKDNEDKVRSAAIVALGRFAETSAVPQIIPLLKDNEDKVRFAAIEALGQLGETSVIPQIIPFLRDNEDEVRSAAIEALGQLGETFVIPQIIPFLRDSEDEVRSAAIEALGQLGETSVIPQIIPFLNDYNFYSRFCATLALGKLNATSAIPQILPLLNDHNQFVRAAAAIALGKLDAISTIPQIRSLLNDHDKFVRLEAVQALSELQVTAERMNSFVPQLEEQQQQLVVARGESTSRNPVERRDSATALGSIFTDQSVKILSQLIQDESPKVVKEAVKSVGIIGKYRPDLVQESVSELFALIEHPDPVLRKSVVIALGRLISFRGQKSAENYPEMDKQIRAKLRMILSDSGQKNRLRLSVIDAFGDTSRDDYAAELFALLTKLDKENVNNDSMRYRCLYWLGQMKYVQAQSYAESELKDLEEEEAVWRKQRDSEEQASNTTDEVRADRQGKTWRKEHWGSMLGNALARIKPETTGIKLLNHPLYQVRQGAIRALASRIADGAADAALIDKIIQAHQNFNPEDLPSPFPYAAFQAIDLALWNLEYSGKKDDVSKLQEILKNLKPCQVPGQEGAIKERLEWTIERLAENLAKNAELAADE